MAKRQLSAASRALLRDRMIEDFLVNAIECLLDGDGLGERHRAILNRAFARVAVAAIDRAAREEERSK